MGTSANNLSPRWMTLSFKDSILLKSIIWIRTSLTKSISFSLVPLHESFLITRMFCDCSLLWFRTGDPLPSYPLCRMVPRPSPPSDGLPSHPIWASHTSILTSEELEPLFQPITLMRLFRVLHSLPNGKTPGMDGLPREFFVHYWKHIGPLFLRMTQQFLARYIPPSLLRGVADLIY